MHARSAVTAGSGRPPGASVVAAPGGGGRRGAGLPARAGSHSVRYIHQHSLFEAGEALTAAQQAVRPSMAVISNASGLLPGLLEQSDARWAGHTSGDPDYQKNYALRRQSVSTFLIPDFVSGLDFSWRSAHASARLRGHRWRGLTTPLYAFGSAAKQTAVAAAVHPRLRRRWPGVSWSTIAECAGAVRRTVLMAHQSALNSPGFERLYLFASITRDDSDVDLVFDYPCGGLVAPSCWM